uniref:Uncharacterized protein n=1 Tax=uncultured marine group II/III euryarchaeote KM3_83_G03 TaxID=1456522 RepID=A0A075HS77_9EURY|nr:hypothetical protein [uncultured marine group II/III euryarchaeote KM3_83_G03]
MCEARKCSVFSKLYKRIKIRYSVKNSVFLVNSLIFAIFFLIGCTDVNLEKVESKDHIVNCGNEGETHPDTMLKEAKINFDMRECFYQALKECSPAKMNTLVLGGAINYNFRIEPKNGKCNIHMIRDNIEGGEVKIKRQGVCETYEAFDTLQVPRWSDPEGLIPSYWKFSFRDCTGEMPSESYRY